MALLKAGEFFFEAHFKTPFYWDDPTYELIKQHFDHLIIGNDREAAVKFAKWVYRHPDTQYVSVGTMTKDDGSDYIEFFHKEKFGFWLGCQLIGLKFKIENYLEEQEEFLKNLKKDSEE